MGGEPLAPQYDEGEELSAKERIVQVRQRLGLPVLSDEELQTYIAQADAATEESRAQAIKSHLESEATNEGSKSKEG